MIGFYKNVTEADYLKSLGSYKDAIVYTKDTKKIFVNGIAYGGEEISEIKAALLSQKVSQVEDKAPSCKAVDDYVATGIAELEQSVSESMQALVSKSAIKQTLSDSTTDVPSCKAVKDAIAETSLYYGVEFDVTISSPNCTRIGANSLHRTLPIQSMMRGCLLDDDGNVTKYLDANDWTEEVRDGSQGQVMVEIPRHYRKFETEGNKRRVLLSTVPLAGYKEVPKIYVSAYEATFQRSTNKLASVVNLTADYRGGYNQAAWDGTYRSVLGRPVTNINRTSFRAYARNRKGGSSEWNIYTYEAHKTLYWLFVVEYATLNSQAAYNAELTSEGFRQGGLGEGVSTVGSAIASGKEHAGETSVKWATFNGNYPFVPCGFTDRLGNGTGQVEYSVQDTSTQAWLDEYVPRYRGIENPFGHIWHFVDGINVRVNPTEANGGNNKSEIFTCDNPSKFNDTTYDGYNFVGLEARDSGFIKELIFGEGGEIMPASVGGGSSTYYCDYHYAIIESKTALRAVYFGGSSEFGANDGLVCTLSNNTPSTPNTKLGTRLCFIPNNNN